jgi:hypothetical protein
LRSAIGTITSTRTITIERVSQDGAWQSRELRIIDEQIEILLLTTDTGNRQRTDTGNSRRWDEHEHEDEDDNDWRVVEDKASQSGNSESSTNRSIFLH